MCDLVHCEWPLPDVSFQNKMFETESLGNQGLRYRITKKGRLVRLLSEEVPAYKGPQYTEDLDLPIDGEVRLTSRWTSAGEPRLSVVFRFREGLVQWVRLASDMASFSELLERACTHLPGDYTLG